MEDIISAGLISLGALLLGAILGALFVSPFESGGPRSLFGHFISAVIVALLVPAVPVLIWGTQVYTSSFDGTMNIVAFGSGTAGVLLSALIIWKSAPGRVREYLELVQEVKPFVLKHFQLLDGDEDGVLCGGDLGQAAAEKLLTDENDLRVLEFVRYNLRVIGHGVGSDRGYSHTVSVISPRDVEGFAERELALYAAWRQ